MKCLIGTGIGMGHISCFGAPSEKRDGEKLIASLMQPEVTLMVKVDEVVEYQETKEFDALGECFVNFERASITVRFFSNYSDIKSIEPGFIYIMNGILYMYENETGINLISPEFERAESLLSRHFMSEVEQRFNAAEN
jgi:hypothetical protein